MNITDSVLTSIKKLLGIAEEYEHFDADLIMHINSVFSILTQRAYKAAYPSCKKDSSADANARKLLGNARIREYIDEKLDEMHSAKTADAQEVLEYLTSVMRGEREDEVLRFIGDGYQDTTTLQVPTKERLKAAELLGKRFGLFTEKVQMDISPVTIIDSIPKENANV